MALHEDARVVVTAGGEIARRRSGIAGVSGDESDSGALLRAALGGHTRLLSIETPTVADADACFLDGHAVRTADDWTRVIARGDLARVSGAFVVAWRSRGGAVHLARDPIGHRSVYYAVKGERLVFASTLRALLDAGAVPRRLALRSVATYLAYAYIPGRETMVEGAFELLPGERLTFESGRLTGQFFWDLPEERSTFASESELKARLRRTLEDTVTELLPEDESVAASLSGGIDSSLVVALAARLHPFTVHTFSITFGEGYKDELYYSSLVAQHCATRHTIVELPPDAIAAHVDDTIASLDKPNGDPLTVPNALLFREMANHASVALNGEGGDPCFGGPKNLPMVLSELYGDGEDSRGARERSYLRAHQKCFDDLAEMLEPEALAVAQTHRLEDDLTSWFVDPRWRSLVTRLMAINVRFKGGHHILPKVHALSAASGIFARSPLFATKVVELAFTIPPQAHLRGSTEKYLLKEAVADLLPREIVERPKCGMLVPVEAWFQGPLLGDARARLLDGVLPRTIFRRAYLEGLLAGTLGGLRPRRGVKIWLLITLESHLRALGVAQRT